LGPAAKIKKATPLRLEIQAPHICPFEGAEGDFFFARAACLISIRVNTGDLCGLCQLRSALKRPFLARLSPRRGYQAPWISLRRNEIAASPTTAYREKKMRKMVQFGCSLCISFASPLHARIALYVEQVNERKLACV
jgi:hypothetical protein